MISSNTSGGLYRRIMLKNYQPLIDPSMFTPLQRLHGAPMAALKHAFIALGSIRIIALLIEGRDDLRRL